jgi:hypothetical protein
LAESFSNGQTALPVEPSPQLSELDNPYDPEKRSGIPFLFDASYYQGKYYLYWGPAPAVIITLLKLPTGQNIGDELIGFFAIVLIFLFSSLTLLYLRRKYFPSIPDWLLAVSILIVGTSHPMLWFLSWPSIYFAAIACGQAFLLAGVYFILPVLDSSSRNPLRLLGVGIVWALAIGSRITLIIPVGFLLITTVILLASEKRTTSKPGALAGRIIALGFPIVIAIALLGFYNQVRFGDPIETGLRYQLSKLDQKTIIEQGRHFNIAFGLPNSVYYLLTPFRIRASFPFIRPLLNKFPTFSGYLESFTPPEHHIDNVTGLLWAMPTILFCGVLVREIICCRQITTPSSSPNKTRTGQQGNHQSIKRIGSILLITGLAAASPVLVYYWVSNRFLLEVVPLLAICSTLGIWLIYRKSLVFPLTRILINSLIISAVIVSTLISLLLTFTGAWNQFDDLNPALWNTLTDLFSW